MWLAPLARVVIVVLTAVACATIITDASEAADTHPCTSTGFIIGYGHVGDIISELPINEDNTIHETVCRTGDDKIRYYRAWANTDAERAELLRMAKIDAKPRYPIALCGMDKARSHVTDLAYFYFASIKKITPAERSGYKAWLLRYAERRDCQVLD